MECPDELLDALAEVLTTAILRIRAAAYQNDSARCAVEADHVEADHVHNLPALLRRCDIDGVRFYWNTERTAFVEQSTGVDTAAFQTAWNTISRHGQ
jgi:hypothetical protein